MHSKGRSRRSDQLRRLGRSSLRANSEHSFDADLNGARDSMFRDPRVVLGLLALWALIAVVWAMVGD